MDVKRETDFTVLEKNAIKKYFVKYYENSLSEGLIQALLINLNNFAL